MSYSCVAKGGVAAWRAYTAQGEVVAGSDPSERPFFGYNSERQDAATGLVDMHARRYDSSSGRFGVADTLLGALSDPLSLNRYLYCESDPVNFTDPTGHASRTMRLSKGKGISVNLRGIKPKKKLASWDANAVSGQANLDPVWRDFNMLSGALQMHTTTYGARKAAYGNTIRLNGERADLIERKYGWDARQAFSAQVARNFKVHVERYYCGSNPHLNEVASTLHTFAQDYWYLPVVPTLADWCAYVSEGDVQNTVLYSFYSLLDVVPGGSSVFRIGENFTVKASSKLMLGAGIESAKKADSLIFSSANKSASKLAGQMKSRNWTKEDVRNVVRDPYATSPSTYKGEGQNSLTAYFEKDGSHVVVDDVTNEVIQVSDRGNPNWEPDESIIDPYIPS